MIIKAQENLSFSPLSLCHVTEKFINIPADAHSSSATAAVFFLWSTVYMVWTMFPLFLYILGAFAWLDIKWISTTCLHTADTSRNAMTQLSPQSQWGKWWSRRDNISGVTPRALMWLLFATFHRAEGRGAPSWERSVNTVVIFPAQSVIYKFSRLLNHPPNTPTLHLVSWHSLLLRMQSGACDEEEGATAE